jgi:hypothetical protein
MTPLKPTRIIVDLDGTFSNVEHRRHFVAKPNPNWKSFYEALSEDGANEWCLELLKRFNKDEILFVTGRPEEYRDRTRAWLMDYGYAQCPLFMRKTGDYRQDSIIKTEIYKEHIEHNYHILFCLDDRTQVVKAWRALGLVCLQCDEGDF